MTELSKKDQATLDMIARATVEQGFIYIAEKLVKKLVDNGLVEVNNDMKDEAGNPAVRTIQQVVVQIQQQGTQEMKFELSTGIAIPPATRKSSGSRSIYPFEQMEVGQSFFVADADKPIKSKDGTVMYDAFQGMTSVLSSANDRFSELTGNTVIAKKGKLAGKEVAEKRYLRRFVQRAVEENGVKGTRVWREL